MISTSPAAATIEAGSATVEVSFEQRESSGPWHVGFTVQRGQAQPWERAFRIFDGCSNLRRHQAKMESLGYKLEGPHKVAPYTEYSLRRTKPASWRNH